MSYRLKVKSVNKRPLPEVAGLLGATALLSGAITGVLLSMLRAHLTRKGEAPTEENVKQLAAAVQEEASPEDLNTVQSGTASPQVTTRVQQAISAAAERIDTQPEQSQKPTADNSNIEFLKLYQEQTPQARTEIMKYVLRNFSKLNDKEKQKYMNDTTVYAKQFINKFNELGRKLNKPEDLDLIAKELTKTAEEQPAAQAAEKGKQSAKKGEQTKQAAAPATQASEKTSKTVPARFGATVEFLERELPDLKIKWKNNKEAVILIMKALNDSASAGLIADIPRVTVKPLRPLPPVTEAENESEKKAKPKRAAPTPTTGLQFILNDLFKQDVFKKLFRMNTEAKGAIEKLFTNLAEKPVAQSATAPAPEAPPAMQPPTTAQAATSIEKPAQAVSAPAVPAQAASASAVAEPSKEQTTKQDNKNTNIPYKISVPPLESDEDFRNFLNSPLREQLVPLCNLNDNELVAKLEEYGLASKTKKMFKKNAHRFVPIGNIGSLVFPPKILLVKQVSLLNTLFNIPQSADKYKVVSLPYFYASNEEYQLTDDLISKGAIEVVEEPKQKQESLYEGLFDKFITNKQTNSSKQLFSFDGNKFKKYNRG